MVKNEGTVGLPAEDNSWWRAETYDFALPPELVAERPAEPRETARLLHVGDDLEDFTVADLPRLLSPGDLLVVNDTRVLPTALSGMRGPARVQITLHKQAGDGLWRAFAKPAKRLKPGDRVSFASGFEADVVERSEGEVLLRFPGGEEKLRADLVRHGTMPIPPYIRRGPDERDRSDYQTKLWAVSLAVAAPTAGLGYGWPSRCRRPQRPHDGKAR